MPARTLRDVRVRALALLVAGGLLATACAGEGYRASNVQRELVKAGLTARQASCVTDRLEDKYDPRQLGSYSSPTQQEINTTTAAIAACKKSYPG